MRSKALEQRTRRRNVPKPKVQLTRPYLEILEDRLVLSATAVSAKGSLDYLRLVMDRYHDHFGVYDDVSSADSHFVAYAKIPNGSAAVTMNGSCGLENPDCTTVPHSGASAIRAQFFSSGNNFGGFYFQNGVLEPDGKAPIPNFGEVPNAGITQLVGATSISFWARGHNGSEKIEFFLAGVGRHPVTGEAIAPYPDSSPRYPPVGDPQALVELSTTWKKYSFNVSTLDLSYVLGGFGWVANAPNNPGGATFYLDDIRYELNAEARAQRLNEPRFLRSFTTHFTQNTPADFDFALRNSAFTYDNALAILAFLADRNADTSADSAHRAKLIGDALLYASAHDRKFTDGRLRSDYAAGDISLPPGWIPYGKVGTVAIPGFYIEDPAMFFEVGQERVDTGNNTWAMIALLALYTRTSDPKYLDLAQTIGQVIRNFKQTTGTYQGFTGGYVKESDVKWPWASTEHNLDVYAAFSTMFEITGDQQWKSDANHAKTFVDQMWDHPPFQGCYLTGTENPELINISVLPLDPQSWSTLAIPSNPLAQQAITCAETHHLTTADGFTGFDFNEDKDGVWFEGTGQMVAAYLFNGKPAEAEFFRKELQRAQVMPPFGNGRGIAAASHDHLSTGFDDFEYYRRLHVGATAWNLFAQLGYNPYYQSFFLSPDVAPVSIFALGGAAPGDEHGVVQLRKINNEILYEFSPFGFVATGGVTVAIGDLDNDGYDDVVTGAAFGNPHIKVYNGRAIAAGTFNPANPDASLIAQVFPFALQFNVGANIAVGDVNNDGFADLVAGASTGNPHVKVYSGESIAKGTFNANSEAALIAAFFAYGLNFNVGTNVAAGDVNGDAFPDIVTGATVGNPHVKAYTGQAVATGALLNPLNPDVFLLASYFADLLQFNIGANVTVGHMNNDGYREIVTGATAGNPHVKIYSGQAVASGELLNSGNPDKYLLDDFFDFALDSNIGIYVGVTDVNINGKSDFLVGASTVPHYKALERNPWGTPVFFEAILNLKGGIRVAG